MADDTYHQTVQPRIFGRSNRAFVPAVSRQTQTNNSFIVQYTSVILILLTVTVGSFSSRHSERAAHSRLPPLPQQPPLAAVPLPDLFHSISIEPSDDQLTAIHQLIGQHDIRARLVLPLDPKKTELSFHRFQAIIGAVIKSGITPELLTVELDESLNGAPLLIVEKSPL